MTTATEPNKPLAIGYSQEQDTAMREGYRTASDRIHDLLTLVQPFGFEFDQLPNGLEPMVLALVESIQIESAIPISTAKKLSFIDFPKSIIEDCYNDLHQLFDEHQLSWNDFEFIEGQVLPSNEALERITAACTIYATTEREKAIYKACQGLIHATEEAAQVLNLDKGYLQPLTRNLINHGKVNIGQLKLLSR